MPTILLHENYTVVWIAVLPIEVEAALHALDTIHEGQFQSDYNDDYTYIGGTINSHNIVVAKLHAGQNYGVGSAAALVNHVKARFINVRFALLVGVAAGLPNLSSLPTTRQRDIRLGDVLVCVPDKTSTGVFHYDLGTDAGSGVQSTGRQAAPPALVLSAINDIRLLGKDVFHRGSELSSHLEKFLAKAVDHKFDYPGADNDELYEASGLLASPEADDWLLVRTLRDDLEPSRAWYGGIGSGSTLMRNAARRDQLRDTYDLIGLEMEAAGVMNTLPTGVIRGVCDYGDAHKTKQWQPYAAAVAAVYAKMVLLRITPKVVPSQHVDVAHTFPFPRNEDVIIRDELFDVLQQLLPTRNSYQSAALWGLGGSGKTQIALEFAYRRHINDQFRVFWVHADSYTKFLNGYQQIAKVAKLSSKLQGEDMLTAVREWLESQSKWLLVLDNADDLSLFTATARSVAPVLTRSLRDYIPRGAQGSILWTTRDRSAVGGLVGFQKGLNVSKMTTSEAHKLLTSITRREITADNTDDVSELLDILEQLPLAIVQAASYINETKLSYTEYLTRFRKERKRRRMLAVENPLPFRQDGVSNSVMHTWQITIDHLQVQFPIAAWVLRVVAWYHNQALPQILLDAAGRQCVKAYVSGPPHVYSHTFHEDDTDRTKTAIDDDDDKVQKDQELKYASDESNDSDDDDDQIRIALTQLERFSFLNQRFTTDNESIYDIHKLVQEATRSANFEPSQEANITSKPIDVAFGIMRRLFPSGRYGTWPTCKALMPHALAICDLKSGGTKDRQIARVLNQVSIYLQHQRRLIEAEAINVKILSLRQKTLGEHHPDTLSTMNNLAINLYQLGQVSQAQRLHLEVLRLRKEQLGDMDPLTISTMASLAATYRGQKNFKEAEKLNFEVLAARKRLLGDKHPDTLKSMAYLAITYHEQSRYKDAEPLDLQVLALRKEVLGEKHPSTLKSMSKLATTYYVQGRYAEAESLDSQVLTLRRELLGDKHPDTIEAMASMAMTYYSQDQPNKATRAMHDVLRLRREMLGELHVSTVETIDYLIAELNMDKHGKKLPYRSNEHYLDELT